MATRDLTHTGSNGYFCRKNNRRMFRKLKELYNEYKPYVRVDLIMYGVLILLIILYGIFSMIF
jgi:hypothetical protein